MIERQLNVQKLAGEACFATDYEAKSRAEQQFYSLCMALSQPNLHNLIAAYSETVLFVAMEYIYKLIPGLKNRRQYFQVINSCAQHWFNARNNGGLSRNGTQDLQLYVQKSVGRTIGQCLKHIYLSKDDSTWVTNFIKERANHKYRLYLWSLFIQTVSVVDNELTFLVYRAMVYGFQQHVIPEIMDALLPFFDSVREQMQINDLSALQSHLSVSESGAGGERVQLFDPGQVRFTELVFNVLKEIICFNYNITYSEYESEVPIDNCLVSFPDPVTRKVANKDFLKAVFYMAEKLITDTSDAGKQNKQFLATTLECIQKIALTKLFYTPQETKREFVKTILACLCRLMACQLTESIMLSLLESNHKLLINIDLFQMKGHDEFPGWFERVKILLLGAIARTTLHFENQLASQCIELTCKILDESVSPQLKDDSQHFKAFGTEIVMHFLERLFTQDYCVVGQNRIKNWEDFKKNLSVFLKRIRQLCCLDLKSICDHLNSLFFGVLSAGTENSIANVFLLLSQFCDRSILERNMLYDPQPPESKSALGKVFCLCLEWITGYRNCGGKSECIQVSILIFIERLLSESLSSFSYEDNQIRISCDLYRGIEENRPALNPEAFLSFCYSQIAQNLMSNDFGYASYTFQVLSTQLLKFKWGIKREYFKQTSIARDVLNLCRGLSETNFSGQKLVLRKELFKIITNISFDDILDDYRTNINELVAGLEKSLAENKWRAMYDLTGICEAIDTSVIYRYFNVTLEKSSIPVATIMGVLFAGLQEVEPKSRPELIRAILKLSQSMIENKGQRLSGTKNIFYNYKLIGALMPYWAYLLEQQSSGSQNWDQILLMLYRIFNTLLKNNNTNFFVLERTIPSYGQYLRLFFFNMVRISSWVQLYPTLFGEYRMAMTLISKQLMQVIFTSKDSQVVLAFNNILTIFMLLNIKSIDMLSQGNRSSEQQLQTYLEMVRNVFKYLRNARKLQHKGMQIENIGVLNEKVDTKYDYILTLFKFGISAGKKMPRTLEQICRVIHHMDFLARAAMPIISGKLGLAEAARQELLEIWNEAETGDHLYNEELEDNEFLCCIKDWFKKCDTNSMIEPQY